MGASIPLNVKARQSSKSTNADLRYGKRIRSRMTEVVSDQGVICDGGYNKQMEFHYSKLFFKDPNHVNNHGARLLLLITAVQTHIPNFLLNHPGSQSTAKYDHSNRGHSIRHSVSRRGSGYGLARRRGVTGEVGQSSTS